MFTKLAALACFFGLARAGALLSAGYGYDGLGAYGSYGSHGGYGGYSDYGGYGHTKYVGGSAISHQSVVKQVAVPVTYTQLASYAPAVSYASQYHAPASYAYAVPSYGGYGHASYGYGGYGKW